MKIRLYSLLLAVAASVGTMFASTKIGDLYYNLDATNQTAEVAQSSSVSGDLVIPSTVTYNSVTYSVTSIGYGAFSSCSSLTSVTIPNSVTSIGGYAFCDCTGLTSVTIPNSVTSIGSMAFYNVPNIVYSGGATGSPWGARSINGYVDGYLVYSDNTKTTLLACYAAAQGEIIVPNSVTSIGNSAFCDCTGLTSVTIPNSVTSIGGWAFQGCTGLTSVTIPNSVTSIGSSTFNGCSGLTSVTIPNSVTSIGVSAFWNCTGLTSIEIPNSVTSIGGSAFSYCSSLTSVAIPNSVTSIGHEAFRDCDSLSSIVAPAVLFNNSDDIFLYAHGEYGDKMISMISHLTINGGTLTQYAFDQIRVSYRKLEYVNLSATENTEMPDEAFKGCYNLRTLILPMNLERIGYMAITECVNLESIAIPASVEEIGDRAFEDCRSIKTITFGGAPANAPGRFSTPASSTSQLHKIGNWAFYNAHELQNLDIPEGVTEIGDGAFYGCTYLEEMVLPSSVQEIGDNTFALCSKLKKITVNSLTPPTIQAKTFYDVKRQIPVYVPDESVDAYKNDAYWHEFDIQGRSNMPTGLEEISSSLQGGDRGRLILHNGQIFILRGEKVYTLQGQEVR